MKKDFSTSIETVGGHKVRDIKFNAIANGYLGFVSDPLWKDASTQKDGMVTGRWTKSGKCINQTRPELNLKYIKP